MKATRLTLLALFSIAAVAPATAQRPLALPGSTWGGVRYPSSAELEEKRNFILEGAVEQGADWLQVSRRGVLNTFVRAEYKADSERFDWNNKVQLEAGLKLRFPVADVGVVELGGKYSVDMRWVTDRVESSPVMYLNWGGSWDLKNRGRH